MPENKRLVLLIVIMTIVSLIVGGIAISVPYFTVIDNSLIRAQFIKAACGGLAVAIVVVVVVASLLFARVTNPMLSGIHERESRLRSILDTAVDAIITIDDRGIIESLNPATETMFGYAAVELVGQNVKLLMPAPYAEQHDEYLANYVRTGDKKIIGIGREVEGRRKDGSTFPMGLSVSEVWLSGHRFFTGIVHDISEQKQAQAALAESENLLRTIFDTDPECVKLLGADGNLLMINRAGRNMLEMDSSDHIHGQCVFPLVAEEYRQAFQDLTQRVFQGESGTLEFEIVGAKGTRRRLDTHAVPLRDHNGTITAFLGITRDVTANRQAEERAMQAERLAGIGQMVAGLAHESRNAIQRAQACQEMLALDLEDQPELRDMTAQTQRALDDLHRLYEEVRGYSAPIILDFENCNLSEVWSRAWTNLKLMRQEKECTLVEDVGDTVLMCHVDRHRIEQVIRNILENAIAACDEPGEIVVKCADADLDGVPAIRVALCDNGPGLSNDQASSIFEPFYTTKKKGTGLGMAIAKRIVESHGGRIEVGCSGHRGTEIVVTLPRNQA